MDTFHTCTTKHDSLLWQQDKEKELRVFCSICLNNMKKWQNYLCNSVKDIEIKSTRLRSMKWASGLLLWSCTVSAYSNFWAAHRRTARVCLDLCRLRKLMKCTYSWTRKASIGLNPDVDVSLEKLSRSRKLLLASSKATVTWHLCPSQITMTNSRMNSPFCRDLWLSLKVTIHFWILTISQ